MQTSQTLAVNNEDVKFLKIISKSLNHQVRLLWLPAPTRRDPVVNPTQVTIVSEEMAFVDYTVYELVKDRAARSYAETARQANPESVTF